MWGITIMRSYNHEIFQSRWDVTIMMRCYNHDEVLQSWWDLTIMMRSYRHEILQSWQSLKIMMKSYSHKILKSWWSFTIVRRSFGHDEVLQLQWGLTNMVLSDNDDEVLQSSEVLRSRWCLAIMISYNHEVLQSWWGHTIHEDVLQSRWGLRPWLSLTIMRSDGYDET